MMKVVMFDFRSYAYLYPPRPEQAIPPELLGHYAKLGWLAQIKLNGTCSILAVHDRRIEQAMNRHNGHHKLWKPNADAERAFKSLPTDGWYVFVGELLHSKVADDKLRNIHYIHDILVEDSQQLVGATYAHRLNRLSELFPMAESLALSHHVVDQNTWIAKSHYHDFAALYETTKNHKEQEGLVLKDPNAKLKLCLTASSNSEWQVKCRRPSKAYSF